jgi:sulfite reductase (NADPH) flavoprotein alpha-component
MMDPEAKTAPSFIPETAPFSPEQRRWLDIFFKDLAALHALPESTLAEAASRLAGNGVAVDDAPWHKPKLPLNERMLLAEGRSMARRMMAAMGQQDCRQCGYDCEEYAEAIARLAEARLNLCVPGGKDTARMLAALVAEAAGGAAAFDAQAYKTRVAAANAPPPAETRPGYHRDNPVTVAIKARERLNPDSAPEAATYHVEIDLDGSGLDYRVGDALGIFPHNDPALVDAVIAAIGASPDVLVGERTLRSLLTSERSLGTAPDALFEMIACMTGGERRRTAKQLAAGKDPDGDAARLDVLAALQKFSGIKPDAEAFADSLDPLQPRLYSIASSLLAQPGIAALTVRHVNYERDGRRRDGVGSSWLSTRGPVGSTLRAYIQRAPHFRLPASGDVPVIMVGPGTGIAPFRAFLQERGATSSASRNWLFFGHRHQATDFFYERELNAFRNSGVLTRLSLAWSRDGDKKTYVHHKMIEEGEELFDWLYDGAHFYVCGDSRHMAGDVERALVEIVADYGNRDEEAAKEWVANLKADGRYRTDVY